MLEDQEQFAQLYQGLRGSCESQGSPAHLLEMCSSQKMIGSTGTRPCNMSLWMLMTNQSKSLELQDIFSYV